MCRHCPNCDCDDVDLTPLPSPRDEIDRLMRELLSRKLMRRFTDSMKIVDLHKVRGITLNLDSMRTAFRNAATELGMRKRLGMPYGVRWIRLEKLPRATTKEEFDREFLQRFEGNDG